MRGIGSFSGVWVLVAVLLLAVGCSFSYSLQELFGELGKLLGQLVARELGDEVPQRCS